MHTQNYFIISALYLAESFIINKKHINIFKFRSNESVLFNTTENIVINKDQENLRIWGQSVNPVVEISNVRAISNLFFGGNVIITFISAKITIKESKGYKVSIQILKPADTEMIILKGTYDTKTNTFISKETESIEVGSIAVKSIDFIILKQQSPPTYQITGVAYNDAQKTIKVKSETISSVSLKPTPATPVKNPDFKISHVDNMKPEETGNIEFKKVGNKYVANIDITITITNLKNMNINNIDLDFMMSSHIGEVDVKYNIVKNDKENTACSSIFKEEAPAESQSIDVSSSLNAYVVNCKETVIAGNTAKSYRIKGSVSSKNSLQNGKMYMLGLDGNFDTSQGNYPYGFFLRSSTYESSNSTTALPPIPKPTESPTRSPNESPTGSPNESSTKSTTGGKVGSTSSKKGISGEAIGVIVSSLLIVIAFVVGITIFIIRKKKNNKEKI